MQVSVNSCSVFNVKEINNLPWRHLNLLPLRTINLFNIKSQNVLKPPAWTKYYVSNFSHLRKGRRALSQSDCNLRREQSKQRQNAKHEVHFYSIASYLVHHGHRPCTKYSDVRCHVSEITLFCMAIIYIRYSFNLFYKA